MSNEPKWSDSDRFKITTETLSKSFNQDQVAVVHIKTRRIHILNPTAVEIWRLLSAGSTRGEMNQQIQQKFQGNENEISAEIDRILALLHGEGLISIHK